MRKPCRSTKDGTRYYQETHARATLPAEQDTRLRALRPGLLAFARRLSRRLSVRVFVSVSLHHLSPTRSSWLILVPAPGPRGERHSERAPKYFWLISSQCRQVYKPIVLLNHPPAIAITEPLGHYLNTTPATPAVARTSRPFRRLDRCPLRPKTPPPASRQRSAAPALSRPAPATVACQHETRRSPNRTSPSISGRHGCTVWLI